METIPIPKLEEDDEQEVEELKDKKLIRGTIYFLVKWINQPFEYNQWILEEDIENARGVITKFRKTKNSKVVRKRQ